MTASVTTALYTALAPLQLPPFNFTGDFLSVTNALQGLGGGLYAWTNKASNIINTVGTYKSSIVLAASAVSLTNNVNTSITSLTLTPGAWDIWGEAWFTLGAGTTISEVQVSINTSAAALSGNPDDGLAATDWGNPASGNNFPCVAGVGPCSPNLTVATTYYLVVCPFFAVSTLAGYGKLCARRWHQ